MNAINFFEMRSTKTKKKRKMDRITRLDYAWDARTLSQWNMDIHTVANLIANVKTGRKSVDFKQAMCELGIAPETIMEDIKRMKLSEVIEAIPPRHGKAHYTVSLLYAMSSWGDITYGEYLERAENENC